MASALVTDPGRALVVCAGGPMSGWWFYADDFAARQESCRRTTTASSPPAASAALQYHRSGQTRPHPLAPVAGEVLHYRPDNPSPGTPVRARRTSSPLEEVLA